MFTLLGVEELPENFSEDQNPLDADMEQHPSRTSTPLPRRRPPPPITIDNVEQSAKLLKKLQELTGQKLQGRVIGRGLRVYPETPAACHQIRNLIDQEKLEAYTYELSENKEIKVVIRGMPVDMPIQEIMEDLENLFIKPSECRVMINRKTRLPMPLFLLSLPKTEDNKNIHHISELCNMKVKIEPLNKRTGPAQCFRCQGFFHNSRFCTRNPKCVKCGKPHLTRDCTKTAEEDPTCCHCQGKHPANFLGCPKNPLNKPHLRPRLMPGRRELSGEEKCKRQPSVRLSRKPPSKIDPLSPEQNLTPKRCSQAPPPANHPQQAHIAQDPDEDHSENLASTLEDFQDPRVVEMLDQRNRPLKVISWNADSIINKIQEFEFFINSQDPDVIALQETRLRPCHNLNLPNYKTYRTDRLTHRGGGTAVLIKSSIPHHVLDIKTHSLENTTIAIEGERNITISSIYRPPRSPAPSLISDLLRIFRNRPECLAVGDYNAIHRTWNHYDRSNAAGNALHKFARNCGFTITAPADPTWISNRRNGRDSTLDFGVSCGLSNIHAQSIFDLSSDHNPVIFTMTPNSTYKYAHNCCTFTNWEQFQNILSVTVPGNPRINNQDAIENAVQNFTHLIQDSINQSKIDQRELKSIKEHAWDCDLEEANHNTDTLFKIINRKKQKQVIYPPLLGYRGLVYDTREKANLFADTLEESFKENKKPYSNIQITKVNRAVRNYLREAPHSLPPLTSPSENKALRTILDVPRRYLHKELKILPVNSRIKQLSTKFHNQTTSHNNPTIQAQSNVISRRRDVHNAARQPSDDVGSLPSLPREDDLHSFYRRLDS
ncbi:nucleic-acid-binding protein from transposon X-element [Trichonephila clavipes]|nr:nucleic-acid-binding protein from transposon X-element [Trichonephila clavipes]